MSVLCQSRYVATESALVAAEYLIREYTFHGTSERCAGLEILNYYLQPNKI